MAPPTLLVIVPPDATTPPLLEVAPLPVIVPVLVRFSTPEANTPAAPPVIVPPA